MENLVVMKNRQAVTSSLKVAEVFEKEHKNVLRDIGNLGKDVLNFEQMFAEGTEPDSYGRDRRVYYMNRDGFTLLAMGFTGKRALEFKLKYIEAFNAMETKIKKAHLSSYMIEDPIKRAEKWIEEETVRQKQAVQIEDMKPKALFADSVAASDTTISVKALAAVLKGEGFDIGQNRLYEWLRKHGYLISRKGIDWNMPTQRSMEMGLFKVKETTLNNPGSTKIVKTVRVTGKGQIYFVNKFIAMYGDKRRENQ